MQSFDDDMPKGSKRAFYQMLTTDTGTKLFTAGCAQLAHQLNYVKTNTLAMNGFVRAAKIEESGRANQHVISDGGCP